MSAFQNLSDVAVMELNTGQPNLVLFAESMMPPNQKHLNAFTTIFPGGVCFGGMVDPRWEVHSTDYDRYNDEVTVVFRRAGRKRGVVEMSCGCDTRGGCADCFALISSSSGDSSE